MLYCAEMTFKRLFTPRNVFYGGVALCCLLLAACATVPRSLPCVVPPPKTLAGWIHLPDAARRCGVAPAGWRVTRDGAQLTTGRHKIRLYPESRRMEVDGVLVWLNAPLTASPPGSSSFYLSPADVRDLAALHAPPPPRLPQNAGRRYLTVMLDAGHGGDDTGAVSAATRRQEKELVLDIARRTAAALARAPVHVILSRDADLALPLDLRVGHAANNRADCLVSIHANAAANSQAEGVETYLVPAAGHGSTGGGAPADAAAGNQSDGANFALAFALHSRFVRVGRPDRGIKRARYHVLLNAPCPAVLLEVGFLSHAAEARLLDQDTHRQRIAEALAAGIRAYAE